MRQAIITKYLGPTNFRGSRVKAIAAAGSVMIGWKSELNSDENHLAAAKKLAEKFNWLPYTKDFLPGGLPNGDYVFVLTERKKRK